MEADTCARRYGRDHQGWGGLKTEAKEVYRVLKQRKQLTHAFKIRKLTNWNNNFAFNLLTLLYDAIVSCIKKIT